jgi:prolactin regulatory element-binding protein
MSKALRNQLCSKKFGQPLFAGAWVSPLKKEGDDGDGGEQTPGKGLVLLAGGGGNQRTGVPNSLLLAEYDFESTELTDAVDTFATGDDPPYRLAAHPAGEAVVCSLEHDCRLFQVRAREDGDSSKVRIGAAEREIPALQGIGEQNCLVFSPDGTRLAAGGEDGHLRVIEWGTFKVLLDKPEAHKSIKDLDFSVDGAFVASTSDGSACRIWDVASGECVASLSGEGIGFVRFSRGSSRPLLFAAVRKRGMGFISTFDSSSWKQVNSRKLQEDPISAFTISRDGRFLAIGSSEGDIAVVDAETLSICQKLKRAHMIFVTSMEFSAKGEALLSVSGDSSARVTPVSPVRSGSWQGSLLLLIIFFLSIFLVVRGNDVLKDWQQGQSSLGSAVSRIVARFNSSSSFNVNISGRDNA